MSFAMSLVWHGFWPGYFVTFLGSAVIDIAQKGLLKTVPIVIINETVPSFIRLPIVWLITRFLISWVGIPFEYQYIDEFNPVYKSMHYSGFWLILLMLIGMFVLPKKRSDR